ncbi:hypothetical protein SDC9_119167 [bioreactor metagenome]|uniref:Uncharacterized protein n=1 Tax=bioreactor metagenome TaxID=1076179 RepID=A0A645C9B9_9ZZZZ
MAGIGLDLVGRLLDDATQRRERRGLQIGAQRGSGQLAGAAIGTQVACAVTNGDAGGDLHRLRHAGVVPLHGHHAGIGAGHGIQLGLGGSRRVERHVKRALVIIKLRGGHRHPHAGLGGLLGHGHLGHHLIFAPAIGCRQRRRSKGMAEGAGGGGNRRKKQKVTTLHGVQCSR